MRAAVVALLLAGPAEALDVSLEPYRDARRAGALGVVAGRAAAEPRTLGAPAQPFIGTSVRLLPRSEALLARLTQLRETSRDSSRAFAAAAPAMREAHQAYERRLLEAGATDLAPQVVAGQDGRFSIDEVPAGAWVLIAWHSDPVDTSAPRLPTRQRDRYRPQPTLLGYEAVTVWLRELTVEAGATANVELTDRNGWFRGVVEKRAPVRGR